MGVAVSALPLEGVRVLDLSRLLPGGFCSQLLADLGADVVKVEDTGAGDYAGWRRPTTPARSPVRVRRSSWRSTATSARSSWI
ncbi:hypothetical protein GKE82_26620 [Conexibacter sp. W3-3-2]|uniref:CoA transferase n=1 Tax=Conexibacter sp. W3-3-2 TaxID=2675227 RepID=UPI0012B82CAF|nr:hypothetical protein [Conexibacter sp. W3-3-2]